MAPRDDHPWTEEERAACIEVRRLLVEQHEVPAAEISERELITITMNSKCRVDEAVKKYMVYYKDLLKEFKIEDLWGDDEATDQQWHRLLVAGRDDGDRGIMWVGGGPTPVEEETACVRACCLYFFAVHADMHTLRNGISLVIDTSKNNGAKKVGNEKKLQVAWQNYPTRAQHIFILGTNAFTRVAINGLISFASLFTKSKIIGRIRFANLAEVGKLFGEENLPEKEGGSPKEETGAWVKKRVADFPLMGLPPYA